ncbi:glutathione/cysteine ABC transporter permease/ATPase [Microbacterium sorbitolivorans]|uniref:Thiol reductant ABC exporter subunit CydC n=1 Tax=Microbacterium sorbitolivorans TaxID=1867410 RepID=A0A367Y510_9MICO|nr:thiol reductant ABC exporter subunit CydC [Microbacterium sorbitolivorans]RCK60101.1 thiol reductant ABC exporter subunit CydC [Microbacterium sorbitolivorans]GGF42781.1 glutathione/cysteine ABC transporter permease/ATPase [Microbacterium sorbitolivorans]
MESPRPDLGPVPKPALAALGILAALKALGLVLVAGAIAAGIAGLADGDLDAGFVAALGSAGAIVRALAGWGTKVVAARVAIAVKQDLRGQLWDRIVGGDAEGAEGADSDADRPVDPARISEGSEREGSVAVLATDGLDDLDDYFSQSLPAMIQAVVVPLLVGARILGADWLSALIIVLTIPLVPLFMILIGKHTQEKTDEATGSLARLANHLTELARGLPVLVGLGRVEEQSRALGDIQGEYRRRTQITLRTAFLSALALELISTISVALVAVVLGLRLMNGTVGLEAALLALILAPECFQAMRELGSAFHSSQNGASALARVKRILGGARRGDVRGARLNVVARQGGSAVRALTRPVPVTRLPEGFPSLSEVVAQLAEPGERTAEHAPTTIVVHELWVRHEGRESPTLERFSAQIGGITAVSGPSGSGKSTLLKALAGALPSSAHASGWIVGVDAERTAYAPQTPRAFTATPWDELALYGAEDPGALLAEVGLERRADAATAELSPGEQRRLAVARALARVDDGATLLILDEPTAHLDRESAELVRDAIRCRAKRATVVLATHEPETLALADRIVGVAPLADEVLAPIAPAPVGVPLSTGPIKIAGGPESQAIELPKLRGPGHRALSREGARARREIASLLRPDALRWALGALLAFVTTGMGLALTAVSGWLIVRSSIEEFIMYLLVAIVGVRFFGIGRAVSRYAERLATHAASFSTVDRLRLKLWRGVAARGAGSRRLLEGGSPVDYLVTIADDLRDQLPRIIPALVAGLLAIVGIVVTTALVAPGLAVPVALALVFATALGSAIAVWAARGSMRTRVKERSALARGTASLALAADDLRANGRAVPAIARLDRAADRLARAERGSAWCAGLADAVVVLACSALAAGAPLLAGGLAAEFACVVALLALAAVEPLTGLVGACHRLPALRELALRIAPLAEDPTPVMTGETPIPRPVSSVVLDDVAAAYPGQAVPVFRHVSGEVAPGEWLVVSGPSGSGKSTLLSVLMGSLAAAEGAVYASGISLARAEADSWRDAVAWCPQDAYVFDSRIRANLAIARSRENAPTDDEMTDALARVGLSLGLDTRVGAGGSALSGGERQRLAVARALLTSAEVILLDEPAAHLDRPTAEAMMADIRRATADRIVVLVSHRPDAQAPEGATVISLG